MKYLLNRREFHAALTVFDETGNGIKYVGKPNANHCSATKK